MALNTPQIRELLRGFSFKQLFNEELGWDRHNAQLQISVDGQTFTLSAVAEKHGMAVFVCAPGNKSRIPDYPMRRKIERQVTKSAHEHLIIFIDGKQSLQVWQWVRREHGKPAACREHTYHAGQPGDSLIQKLSALLVSLEEEESLTLPDVTGRARRAFDVERVTKKFYDRFKSEHASFLEFLSGIPDEELERWYVSVMLNRLMFIYFIQKKGFLNSDTDYLKDKLTLCKKEIGKDRYYRDVLCPLFFEGFAKQKEERSEKARKLLGEVPYLNGGIFMPHQVEQFHGNPIEIPDKAFEKLFEFFDAYHWHLDERPLKRDDEINPDVLGYIFEKYINQKQMGAYYTKEDITGYISKNTVIPFIFDATREKCKVAFEGERSIWWLLREDPDRYIYPAVKHGFEFTLPPEISAGVADVSKRDGWNKPAPREYALPTEIWREVVARRMRYEEVRNKLAAGEICSINDLITYNLDIRQFAQDVIENCEGPELLVAFWKAIGSVTVLDSTCGSGAFLFAALNILEPLYEACLERMRFFLEEWGATGKKNHPNYYKLFTETLKRVEDHPNHRYFVLKSIIVNNLFGVDIMEEAIEICKLRLFLKLVAQVETAEKIEPLPDIDFNIRTGNTLVGFVKLQDIRDAAENEANRNIHGERQSLLLLGEKEEQLRSIEEEADIADKAFQMFRRQQTELGGQVTAKDKKDLITRLKILANKLDLYLACEYGINESSILNKTKYENAFKKWHDSHKPFHWFIEFYGILKTGGFDVIIGNPPYVEYSKVKKDYTIIRYETESCGNLYAYIIERCFNTLCHNGRMGMIVQLPIVCTDRMKPLQKECVAQSSSIWFANFDDRPARLFDGLEHIRATIFSSKKRKAANGQVYSTAYNRWYSEARAQLFEVLSFEEISAYLVDGAIPKIGQATAKLVKEHTAILAPLLEDLSKNVLGTPVFFHNAPQYWVRAMDFAPYFWNERGGEQISTQIKTLRLPSKSEALVVVAALNSSLFYWWFLILSDCRHLNLREIERFPLGLDRMPEAVKSRLATLAGDLMADFKRHKKRKECQYKATGKVVYDEFYPKYSKSIIDEIDCILAKHYNFMDEELDFIINYDIKYRMGQEATEERGE